jgi:hypothetical protein
MDALTTDLKNKTVGYKQTAVEWLMDNIDFNFNPTTKTFEIDKYHFRVALEMEKEQITKAYNSAIPFKFGEQYYNETYGQE